MQFLGCWELLALSYAGVQLEELIPGKIATYVAYSINLGLMVAIEPPSRLLIWDAVVAGIVMLGAAWLFLPGVSKIVDKIQEDARNRR